MIPSPREDIFFTKKNVISLRKRLMGREARDRLGRERYERAEGEASGYCNRYYRTGRMKTAQGDSGVFSTAIARDGRAVRIGVRENLGGRA